MTRARDLSQPRKCPACSEHWLPIAPRWRYPCCIWCALRIHAYGGHESDLWTPHWWQRRYCLLGEFKTQPLGQTIWAYRCFDDPAAWEGRTYWIYVSYPDSAEPGDTAIDQLQRLWYLVLWRRASGAIVRYLKPYIWGERQ